MGEQLKITKEKTAMIRIISKEKWYYWNMYEVAYEGESYMIIKHFNNDRVIAIPKNSNGWVATSPTNGIAVYDMPVCDAFTKYIEKH